MARLPTAPGWYPDGLNPDEIRYWDGHDWTSQWRPRPTWAPSETQIIRLRTPSLGHRRRVRSRVGPALFTAILAAALLSSAVLAGRQGVGLGSEEGVAVPIISDPSFVAAANQLCAALLHPTSRAGTGTSAAIGAGTSVVTSSTASAAEAAGLSARAKTLALLERRLGALRIDPAGRAAVRQWLSNWGALTAATSREAQAIRSGSSLKGARSQVSSDETTLDDFSETNAIGHCAV